MKAMRQTQVKSLWGELKITKSNVVYIQYVVCRHKDAMRFIACSVV